MFECNRVGMASALISVLLVSFTDYRRQAAVVQVNSGENPLLAARFGVRSVPLIVLIRNGRAAGEISGARQPDAILSWYRDMMNTVT